ncbi:hypothetical protein pEaSNUABM37_00287 [Erwinia phage pEa_SNUABM_37]|nr:hypothetical protein pEaSNUABM37_00287 [Erwinia phage pEa_SNUABM_37]QXO10755.1 hypothetical protein pEaSNUABM48_00287 [Erwinia phage pEa_SNUABM_48]
MAENLEQVEGELIPDLPAHRVDIVADGLHAYFKVLYLKSYVGQFVTDRWYGVFYTFRGGMFITELTDATDEATAYRHTRLVVNEYRPGEIVSSYVFKCLAAGEYEHVIQWAPTAVTIPVVMDLSNNRHTLTTKTIH